MFNLEQYETVDERLEKFWEKYPDGRIDTEIVVINEDRCVIKAYLWKTFLDSVPYASGIAEERLGSSHINKTSFVENCESSAIGRALHTGGISKHSDGKPRPSQSEMAKVQRLSEKPSQAKPAPKLEQQSSVADSPTFPADPWETYTSVLGGETAEPKQLSAQELIQQELDGSVYHEELCAHGQMLNKQGTSKAGKEYFGFVCPARGEGKCPDSVNVWYRIGPDGRWVRPIKGDE